MRSKVLKSCLALAIALAASVGSVEFAHAQAAKGPSGLPLPRFVTLKSKRVNLRIGPGTDYAVSWMYLKSGLPVEIIQNTTTGAVSAMPTAPKVGSTSRCYQASARRLPPRG